ncbi:hypothetical protein TNCT_60601 [Trichonephila clavata]|uniref:Uncharacterized protein n=1 Tax=Trichonephila clavata TaxID=2740835 RepID=A0A8X6I0K2_TRICU|nr:hypothetical protein TNCT_60601 [Trichonephila clavata]
MAGIERSSETLTFKSPIIIGVEDQDRNRVHRLLRNVDDETATDDVFAICLSLAVLQDQNQAPFADPCHILGSRFISFVSTAADCIQQGKKKLTMSETHSEQRKLGKVVESSANKKARREVSKKYGKFTEDCIPDGVFRIGNDVFVFASIYYDSVSVQIRRFKKYGKTNYPTPEGITLDPRWIKYIMRKKKVPESLEELPSGLFPPERHIQITSENFTNFTFKRIKYGPNKEPTFKGISISREQWAEMIEKYGAIENAVIDNVYLCMDFLTAYKTFCEGPIENALPLSLDVSLGQQYLPQILKKSICSLLNEKKD